ncbi:hypothetical protein FCG40_12220 [Fimbriimonadia bacterium ATM]|nr:MAG: hypothetical protein EDM73_10430 [Armatimonadota bacterium]MBC6970617.1 hypothetical protein [Armatimonadota bacterium]MCE7899482.1 hypothetical protein [Armatimonadetes bacterium ATM1]MDL1929741.1 hypothetical protein [Fimbriimonadia bacterium ATM]RIJ96499.1 MAG: hypothetical protein DCC45_07530 [Armatimonadota bacterium]
MIKRLIKTGNSEALILDRTLRAHLGLEGSVEIRLRENEIVLTKPKSIEEIAERIDRRYGRALKRLAK